MAAQARRCRRLAKYADDRTQHTLELLADDYEQRQKAAEEGVGESLPVMRLGPENDLPE